MAQSISETDLKVNKVAERFSETVHLMLNDPSLGLYRIQEHVKKSVPTLIERKVELQNLQSNIQGTCYDLDYSLKTVKSINWNPHFTIMQECLKSAIVSKTNLKKLESELVSVEGQQPSPHDEEFQVEQDLTQQDPVEGFICPACMRVWQSQEELITHWESLHNSIEL